VFGLFIVSVNSTGISIGCFHLGFKTDALVGSPGIFFPIPFPSFPAPRFPCSPLPPTPPPCSFCRRAGPFFFFFFFDSVNLPWHTCFFGLSSLHSLPYPLISPVVFWPQRRLLALGLLLHPQGDRAPFLMPPFFRAPVDLLAQTFFAFLFRFALTSRFFFPITGLFVWYRPPGTIPIFLGPF